MEIIKIQYPDELSTTLGNWGLLEPRPVIVLIGGAAHIAARHSAPVHQAVSVVAATAEAVGAVIVDGGTRTGVMSAIGKDTRYMPC